MAKKRLKIYAKDIEKLPDLHKRLARFVAKATIMIEGIDSENLLQIYANGHRGFFSYDEKDLISKFDKIYDLFVQATPEKPLRLKGEHFFRRDEYDYFGSKPKKKQTTTREQIIAEADMLFHDIFEKIFFMQELKKSGRKPL